LTSQPIERLDVGRAVIALTFDDGPHPVCTPMVLRALTDAGLVATFFVLGQQAEQHPGLVEDLGAAGMGVGVHGWDHAELRGQTPEFVRDQLGRTVDVLRPLAPAPSLFRPPKGWWDDTTLAVAGELGLETVLWTCDTFDWADQSTEAIVDRVLMGLQPGAIVLLHDGGSHDRTGTVAAIARLAPLIRDGAGYQIVDLGDELGPARPAPESLAPDGPTL
jgi:peptidoglycan/xylan/chitin deacetylase (PgdA/CDA1 family)